MSLWFSGADYSQLGLSGPCFLQLTGGLGTLFLLLYLRPDVGKRREWTDPRPPPLGRLNFRRCVWSLGVFSFFALSFIKPNSRALTSPWQWLSEVVSSGVGWILIQLGKFTRVVNQNRKERLHRHPRQVCWGGSRPVCSGVMGGGWLAFQGILMSLGQQPHFGKHGLDIGFCFAKWQERQEGTQISWYAYPVLDCLPQTVY